MKLTAQHTPGPWTVAKNRNEHWGKVEVLGPGVGGSVVVGFTVSTDVSFTKGVEIEANARLIAAAPDLLAACQLMLPVVVDAIMHGMPVTKEVADARNAAVAAIASARGEVQP